MKNTVERAFELAQSGQCRTLTELKQRLRIEGYSNSEAHLGGKLIKKQLRAAMGTNSGCAVPTSQDARFAGAADIGNPDPLTAGC